MTTKYYIRDQGTGAYCEGPEDDFSWINYGSTSTEVTQRPSIAHVWNGSQWELTTDSLKNVYGPKRIEELRRVDVYRLDTTLTIEEGAQRDAYIASLINLDFSDPQNFSFPECPECVKE